jgi:hypothetical protein
MYYLLAYPQYFQALRKEIDENFSFKHQVPIEFTKLPSMKVLNAIMYVPSGFGLVSIDALPFSLFIFYI